MTTITAAQSVLDKKLPLRLEPASCCVCGGFQEATTFARHILGEDRLIITAEDAIASVQVIEAAYASLARSSWTTVPVRPKPAPLPAIEIRAAA